MLLKAINGFFVKRLQEPAAKIEPRNQTQPELQKKSETRMLLPKPDFYISQSLYFSLLLLAFLAISAFSNTAYAASYYCDSCSNCSALISSASISDTIYLSSDIAQSLSEAESCINFTRVGITFDCQGYSIASVNSTGYGLYINAVGNSSAILNIMNCELINFTRAAYFSATGYAYIYNVNFSNSYDGAYIESSNNIDFYNVKSLNNDYLGFYFEDSSHITLSNFSSSGNFYGLYLSNSSYDYINSGVIEDSDAYGIRLYSDSDYNNMENIMIRNNSYSGLWLSYGSGSPGYNLIFDSLFNNSENLRIDSGINESNYFNTSLNCSLSNTTNIIGYSCLGGNYWTSPDANGFSDNCSDRSQAFGICDNSFNFSNSTALVYDYLALTFNDTIAPNITLLGPENNSRNSTSANVSFSFRVIENRDYLSCVLWLSNGSLMPFGNNGSVGYNKTTVISPNSSFSNESYFWWVNCTDGIFESKSEIRNISFYFIDNSSPVMSDLSVSVSNASANISFTTDDLANVSISYGPSTSLGSSYSNSSFSTGHFAALSSLSSNTTYYYNVTLCNNYSYCSSYGLYNFTTNASLEESSNESSSDNSSNSSTNSSNSSSSSSSDNSAPGITFVSPTNMSSINTNINFILKLTTNESASCYVTASKLGSGSASTTDYSLTASSSGLIHTRRFNASGQSSGYNNYFSVNCTDSYNNSALTIVYFKLNDTTAPNVSFLSPTPSNNSYTNSQNITINFTIDDSSATVKIDFDSAGNSTLTSSGGYYSVSKTSLSEGRHSFIVYATDSRSNMKKITRYFTVDLTDPEFEKVKSPSSKQEFGSCSGIIINATISEDGSCSYIIYYKDDDNYDSCLADCGDDYDSCLDRADSSAEREECRNESKECKDDCLADDLYIKELKGSLEDDYRPSVCKDFCDDDEEDCRDSCKETKDSCYSSASTSSDRDKCYDSYDSCLSKCETNSDSCYDKCDDVGYGFSKEIDECLSNGDYLLTLSCSDLAENSAEKNVSFSVNDVTPPVILSSMPNTTVKASSTTLKAITNENAYCKFSTASQNYSQMPYSFYGTYKTHSYSLSGLSNGSYSYYVLCSDMAGNVMDSYYLINFSVAIAGSSTSTGSSSGTKSEANSGQEITKVYSAEIGSIKKGEEKIANFSSSWLSVVEVRLKTLENIAGIKLSLKKLDSNLIVKPDSKSYEFFEITKEGMSNKEIDSVKIVFRVSKSWLSSNSLDEDSIRLAKYSSGWKELSTEKLREDSGYVYYSASVSDLSTFAVIAKESKSSSPSKSAKKDSRASADNAQKSPEKEQPKATSSFFSSWALIAIICAVVVGGGSAGFYFFRRHPQQAPAESDAQHALNAAEASASDETLAVSAPEASAALSPDRSKIDNRDELGSYIADAVDYGMALEEIKARLIESGYSEYDVTSKFLALGLVQKDDNVRAAGKSPSEEFSAQFSEEPSGTNELDEKEVLNQKNYNEAYNEAEQPIRQEAITPESYEMLVSKLGKEIADYTREALSSGLSVEEIKSELISSGYDSEFCEELGAILYKNGNIGIEIESSAHSSNENFNSGKVNSGKGPEAGYEDSFYRDNKSYGASTERTADDAIAKAFFDLGIKKPDELMSYILDALKDKVPKGIIRKMLLESGHKKEEINAVFKEIDERNKKIKKSYALFAGLISSKSHLDSLQKLLSDYRIDEKIAGKLIKKLEKKATFK